MLCSSAFISLRGSEGTRRRWALIISAVMVSAVTLLVNIPAPKALFGPPKSDAVRTAAMKINKRQLVPRQARIASNAFKYSSDLGYYLGARSYGVISLNTTDSMRDIHRQLIKNKIEYYIPVSTEKAGSDYKKLGRTIYEKKLDAQCDNKSSCPVILVIKLDSK